jgi:hypothetical protein
MAVVGFGIGISSHHAQENGILCARYGSHAQENGILCARYGSHAQENGILCARYTSLPPLFFWPTFSKS